jgi:hypothetical protein
MSEAALEKRAPLSVLSLASLFGLFLDKTQYVQHQ